MVKPAPQPQFFPKNMKSWRLEKTPRILDLSRITESSRTAPFWTPWGLREDPELTGEASAAPRDLLAARPDLIECGEKKTPGEKNRGEKPEWDPRETLGSSQHSHFAANYREKAAIPGGSGEGATPNPQREWETFPAFRIVLFLNFNFFFLSF